MRALIPETEVIVALDTNVVRNLCYETPCWVSSFAQMAKNGYHFCLSDVLLAELLHQFEEESFTFAEYSAAIGQVDTFISSDLPFLPGKNQLYQMSGIIDNDLPNDFNPKFVQAYSIATWEWMKTISSSADLFSKPMTFKADGQCYKAAFQKGKARDALDEEREGWSKFIKRYDSLPKDAIPGYQAEMLANMRIEIDSWASCDPPLSVRFDLWIKNILRTVQQRTKSRDPYSPDSRKRKNDGIDILLQHAFLLPAFICLYDKKFLCNFAEIESFQKTWFLTPEELVAQWEQGYAPSPQWPAKKANKTEQTPNN